MSSAHLRRDARLMAVTMTMAAMTLLATGCTKIPEVPVPGLYRVDIRQGNALEDTALSRLEVGMPQSRVLHLLGSPAVDDVFHPDRWDYLYSFAPAGEERDRRRFSLHFEDGKLVRIDGELPSVAEAVAEPKSARVILVPPRPPEKGLLRRALRRVKRDG